MEIEANGYSDDGSNGMKRVSDRGVNEFDLLAISHSGTLRIIIEKMVGDQLPENIEREEQDKNGVREGRLKVPNTSKTVIELRPSENSENLLKTILDYGKCIYWEPKLVDLTNVNHLIKP
jgi:broad specificity phosphatase PhoE